jgi:uncharacterized protein YjiS (DUF1127 family)
MDGITNPRIASTCRNSAAPTGAQARLFAGAWFTGLMARLAAGVSRAAINRRVVGQLSRMSDRELRDICLVRQDVRDSELLLREGDASSFLVGRRNERWGARRRSP